MNETTITVAAILGSCLLIALFFAALVFFGFKNRQRVNAAAAEAHLQDFMSTVTPFTANVDDCLYAITKDYSMTVASFVFKNGKDEEVGEYKTAFKSLGRSDHVLTVDGETYETHLGPSGFNSASVSLYRRGASGAPLATASISLSMFRTTITYRFQDDEILCRKQNTLEQLIDMFSKPYARVATLWRGGEQIGVTNTMGLKGYGRILILPPAIPLHIRAFILITCRD